jgi:hypothetical protein
MKRFNLLVFRYFKFLALACCAIALYGIFTTYWAAAAIFAFLALASMYFADIVNH